tara:strand:+ start:960 stop:2783 length:1824 start_codon:yes stop_codon:yes gene_type:complete
MPDEIDYVKNLIEKREEQSKGAIPIDEWLSTEEGKTVINTFPIKERNLFLDTYNKLLPFFNIIQKVSDDEIRLGVSRGFNNGGLLDNKVGKKINKTTQAGRDVYVTSDGKRVSEISTTFKYKGNWINVPSIFNGYKYDDSTIRLMLDEGLIKPTSTHNNKENAEKAARKRSNELEFNKGGTPMMEKQMEMFEDGGLKDEGGMIDKESGNKVPPGSTRKEVRDDIPAQLSEGEFVFPADVVRFIGLEKLMKLRQQAKMGLKKMEEMGQMGNSDEATLPDDLPFDETDLLIIQDGKPMQMAKGGALTAAEGTDVRDLPTQQSAREQAQAQFIDFNDLIGTGPGGAQLTIREYKNEDGVSIRIRFAGSTPIDNIPEGYYPVDAEGNIIKPDDSEAGETPKEPVETEEERIKRMQSEGGPDDPEAGQVRSLDQMGLKDIIALNKTIQTLDESGGIMGKVIAGLLNKDKVAERAELAKKQMDPTEDKKVIEAINKQKQADAKAEEEETKQKTIDAYNQFAQSKSPTGGGSSSSSTSGTQIDPDGSMAENASKEASTANDGTSDAATSGTGAAGAIDPDASPGIMNKGGLAAKKPKKKPTRKYKKGGLAASKK